MRVPDEYWHGHWLAEDESEGVRREVIKNANTTVPLLENLAVDEDKGVREYVDWWRTEVVRKVVIENANF